MCLTLKPSLSLTLVSLVARVFSQGCSQELANNQVVNSFACESRSFSLSTAFQLILGGLGQGGKASAVSWSGNKAGSGPVAGCVSKKPGLKRERWVSLAAERCHGDLSGYLLGVPVSENLNLSQICFVILTLALATFNFSLVSESFFFIL